MTVQLCISVRSVAKVPVIINKFGKVKNSCYTSHAKFLTQDTKQKMVYFLQTKISTVAPRANILINRKKRTSNSSYSQNTRDFVPITTRIAR